MMLLVSRIMGIVLMCWGFIALEERADLMYI